MSRRPSDYDEEDDNRSLQEALPGRSLTDNLKIGGGIAIIAAFVIFLFQNTEDAEISFLFWDSTMPLFFALLLAAGLGALIMWLFVTFSGRRDAMASRALPNASFS